MMSRQPLILDLIQTPPRYLRSVNLERDMAKPDAVDGYVLTPQACETLWRIADGLHSRDAIRAWTFTGPYGSGKSAMALLMADAMRASLIGEDSPALGLLRTEEAELAAALTGETNGDARGPTLWPIPISGRREPLSVSILKGIGRSLAPHRRRRAVSRLLGDVELALATAARNPADAAGIVDLVARTSETVSGLGDEYGGCFLIVDELGQALGFAAGEGHAGEIFLLQELAELANSGEDSLTAFLGILHQSFEDYARHLSPAVRNEWAKVQGRFEDIPFHESPDQMLRLLGRSIGFSAVHASGQLSQRVSKEVETGTDMGFFPLSSAGSALSEACYSCYPLHPSAAVALPYIFQRFAQNERSLFSFIAASEPNGFRDLLSGRHLTADRPFFVSVPDVFDYLSTSLSPLLRLHPDARGWVQAADALDRNSDITTVDAMVIKTVGVLTMLERMSQIRATEQSIVYCVSCTYAPPQDVKRAIRSLVARSVLVHRKFNQTYRLWDGSDVNIEKALERARQTVSGQMSQAEALARTLPTRPLVARHHSFRTGALRFFEVAYADSPLPASSIPKPASGAEGFVLCCLPGTRASADEFIEWATSGALSQREDVVAAVPKRVDGLSTALLELQALQWVRDNTPELRDDPVARKELAERVAEVERALNWEVQRLTDPRDPPEGSGCQWYHRGTRQPVRGTREMNILVSRVCDDLYPEAVCIQNELINRRDLSPTVAAARNRLLEAMAERASRPALGISGYPPERSIYESVLRATGMHRECSGGWVLGPPHKGSEETLRAAWECIEHALLNREGERVGVTEIAAALAGRPYGLQLGVFPIVLSAYILCRDADVALYEQGGFVPAVTAAILERLAKMPERFALQLFRVAGLRLHLLERLVKSFAVGAGKASGPRSQLLDVVRKLCVFANHLPIYSQRTSRISTTANRVRKALLDAEDPHDLLFRGLPEACGCPPLAADGNTGTDGVEGYVSVLRDALLELQGAYDGLCRSVQELLSDAFGAECGSEEGRQLIASRARGLLDVCVEHRLRALLLRLVDTSSPHAEWVEGIATLLAKKPPREWDDEDEGAFEFELADILRRFQHLESLAIGDGRGGGLPPGTAAYRVSITTIDRGEASRVVFIPPEQKRVIADLSARLTRVLSDSEAISTSAALAAVSMAAERLLDDKAPEAVPGVADERMEDQDG